MTSTSNEVISTNAINSNFFYLTNRVELNELPPPLTIDDQLSQKNKLAISILIILIIVSIFTGCILWYSDSNLIMTENVDGKIVNDPIKTTVWAIGIGLLASTIIAILYIQE
jgi:hypothetical protein